MSCFHDSVHHSPNMYVHMYNVHTEYEFMYNVHREYDYDRLLTKWIA